MAKEYKDMVFGLDIGTHKVMVVAAEVLPEGPGGAGGSELRLAGMGVAPTSGLKRGVVVNIDATVQSIQAALKEAEMMAACKVGAVFTGITGSHIRGINSTGMVIVRDNREVSPVDVARVVETAKAINIPNDQRLLLVEPQEFVIDGHEVKEPIGMSGSRLEVKVHIVTGAGSAAENIVKCVRRCGLEVEQLVLNQIRSRTGAPYSRKEVSGDITRINRLARFKQVDVRAQLLDDGSVRLIYTLLPQNVIADVQISGNKLFSDNDISREVDRWKNAFGAAALNGHACLLPPFSLPVRLLVSDSPWTVTRRTATLRRPSRVLCPHHPAETFCTKRRTFCL